MLNKLMLTLVTAGVAVLAAANGSYKVNILQNTTIQGKEVKAGDYKVQLDGNSATLKHGKETITVPAHTEEAQSKYSGTQIRYVDNAISEIHVGGTNTKIIFTGASEGGSGGSK